MANYSRDRGITWLASGQRDLIITAQLSECGLGKPRSYGDAHFHRARENSLVFPGAGFDVVRSTRHHVVYEGSRVLVLIVQALTRR